MSTSNTAVPVLSEPAEAELVVLGWSKTTVAAALGYSERTIDRFTQNDPTFPAPWGTGKLKRWTPDDVIAWRDRKLNDPVTRIAQRLVTVRGGAS